MQPLREALQMAHANKPALCTPESQVRPQSARTSIGSSFLLPAGRSCTTGGRHSNSDSTLQQHSTQNTLCKPPLKLYTGHVNSNSSSSSGGSSSSWYPAAAQPSMLHVSACPHLPLQMARRVSGAGTLTTYCRRSCTQSTFHPLACWGHPGSHSPGAAHCRPLSCA